MVSLGFARGLLKVGLRLVWGWSSVCLGLSRVGLGLIQSWFMVYWVLFNLSKVDFGIIYRFVEELFGDGLKVLQCWFRRHFLLAQQYLGLV